MKYKFTPEARYKLSTYLITRDEKIIWAEPSMQVWVGESIVKFIAWVENKNAGICSVVGTECTVPRITRSIDADQE